MDSEKILDVQGLSVTFFGESGAHTAVSQISFSLQAGEIFCLVGESGCGKSLTAKALLRLTPENTRLEGKALLNGTDIFSLSSKEMRALRGTDMGMIFQEPMTALNPVLKVGPQCIEHLYLYGKYSRAAAKERCLELFRQVGIPAPESRFNDYPHQLSGGMRQRLVIAMALAGSPSLLLADEPTTALDVTIQWQILQLLQSLAQEQNTSILLITHDLGVVAQMAQKVGVMYAGQMVEYGPVGAIMQDALHPYTQGLLHASPSKHSMELQRLPTIEGSVPSPQNLPTGCRFHPRCPKAMPRCHTEAPPLFVHGVRQIRCWLAE